MYFPHNFLRIDGGPFDSLLHALHLNPEILTSHTGIYAMLVIFVFMLDMLAISHFLIVYMI